MSVAPPTGGLTGRPRKHPVSSERSRGAEAVIDLLKRCPLRRVVRRTGSQGRLLVAERRWTWAIEAAGFRADAIEAALAHRKKDRVAAAYNRVLFLDERRRLARESTDYCANDRGAKVVEQRSQAAR